MTRPRTAPAAARPAGGSNMTTYVLVHGSWHDGACWDAVAALLRTAGHTVHAPTIAGHGRGADRKVTHADCSQSITDYVVKAGLEDIVLVGHSFGGTIICKVAETIPQRIRRLVYQNGFVPRDGHALADEVPPHYNELFAGLRKQSADDTVLLPYPIWREAFINDADERLARASYEYLNPEPAQPFFDKLALGRFYSLEIPRSYINFTEDIALPHGEWAWHPRMSSRLGLYRLVQRPGSHEVCFTNPPLLAEAIVEAGRD
jgi:pimeloyl-ACP methyl ester carboxylesterase